MYRRCLKCGHAIAYPCMKPVKHMGGCGGHLIKITRDEALKTWGKSGDSQTEVRERAGL